MNSKKIFFIINLSMVIFLGVGWFLFYHMILFDDIARMPRALTLNGTILGLNVIFASSLILLLITYRRRK
jgi:hypothetical protein